MSSYELTLSPERPDRNPVTGRFLPGHIPANKGRKLDEYCSKKAQRRMRKGWVNVIKYRPKHRPDTSGRCRKPVAAISDDGRLTVYPFIGAAALAVGGSRESVRRCCAQNSHPTGSGKAAHNTDHRYMGIRFYYESDHAIWSSKIKQ